jgi:hypothetical protein
MLNKCLGAAVAMLLIECGIVRAQPPVPQPTTGFCVNKVTGAIRMQLATTGVPKPCHANELTIDLESLASLQVEQPTPTTRVTRALPAQSVALGAATQPPTIVDANGNTVGVLIGFDFRGNAFAEMSFNGTVLEVPTTSAGFTQTNAGLSGQTIAFFTAANCSSPAMFSVYDSPSGLQLVNTGYMFQLDELSDGIEPQSTAIVGDNIFYAVSPVANPGMAGQMEFTDPANLSVITSGTGTCNPTSGAFPNTGFLVGTPASASLSGFTPPFSIAQW